MGELLTWGETGRKKLEWAINKAKWPDVHAAAHVLLAEFDKAPTAPPAAPTAHLAASPAHVAAASAQHAATASASMRADTTPQPSSIDGSVPPTWTPAPPLPTESGPASSHRTAWLGAVSPSRRTARYRGARG